MKQGYLRLFGDILIYKFGYGGKLLVTVKRLQHGADSGVTNGLNDTLAYCPFDTTQTVEALMPAVKSFLFIYHVHFGCVIRGCSTDSWDLPCNRARFLSDNWQELVYLYTQGSVLLNVTYTCAEAQQSKQNWETLFEEKVEQLFNTIKSYHSCVFVWTWLNYTNKTKWMMTSTHHLLHALSGDWWIDIVTISTNE